MSLVVVIILGLLGLAIGSFISAYTYREPKGESVAKGRSYCDSCKEKLNWYDNIPLLSYFLLFGRSGCCGKKISLRYPIIELSTGLSFTAVYLLATQCSTIFKGFSLQSSILCGYQTALSSFTFPYFLIVTAILIAIFVIDLEHQIIPDELVYLIFTLTFLLFLFSDYQLLYSNLLVGFAAATFFLLLNIVTFGKGMGLGDVKLVLSLGFLLGWPSTLIWVTLSFVIGAFVGVVLILAGKAKFGKHIPFGPFLVLSFFIVLLWGNIIFAYFPVLQLL